MQYLSRGLLNEDEALKLILQGRSFGSASSSATSSPVGTPSASTGLAVRVITRNGVKRPAASRPVVKPASKSASTENLAEDRLEKIEESVPSGSAQLPAATESVSGAGALTEDEQKPGGDGSSPAKRAASDSDSEAEESIYSLSRHSVLEDETSLATFATAAETPATLSPLSDNVETVASADSADVVVDNVNTTTNNNNIGDTKSLPGTDFIYLHFGRKISLSPWWRGLVVSCLSDSEEIGAMVREIESRLGVCRVVA
jgi:hypothetical protein